MNIDFSGGFEMRGWDAPLWMQGKALVGTRRQSSWKLQGFYTLTALTFDENISSTTFDETNSTYFFSKVLLKFEFEVNFSIQLHASLTCEDPEYLQTTYHYAYYLKYAQLKSFFGHQVWAPKPV